MNFEMLPYSRYTIHTFVCNPLCYTCICNSIAKTHRSWLNKRTVTTSHCERDFIYSTIKLKHVNKYIRIICYIKMHISKRITLKRARLLHLSTQFSESYQYHVMTLCISFKYWYNTPILVFADSAISQKSWLIGCRLTIRGYNFHIFRSNV